MYIYIYMYPLSSLELHPPIPTLSGNDQRWFQLLKLVPLHLNWYVEPFEMGTRLGGGTLVIETCQVVKNC